MTNENTDVSASEADKIAADVSAKVAEKPAGEDALPKPAAVTIDDLEAALNRRQGTQNNWNAQQMRQIEASLLAKIDTSLGPLLARQEAETLSRVEQLEPEEQAAYWKTKATQEPEPAPAAPVTPQNGVMDYTDSDRLQLANATTAMLTQLKVSLPYSDDRLWKGATNGMTIEQLVNVARVNAVALSTTPTPSEPAPVENQSTPTSTQAAPASTGSTYGSRTEAQEALLRGDIKDIDEFKSIGAIEGWYKARN